jgi:hypothetical protein
MNLMGLLTRNFVTCTKIRDFPMSRVLKHTNTLLADAVINEPVNTVKLTVMPSSGIPNSLTK